MNFKIDTITASAFVSKLFSTRTQVHIFHVQTKSFAEHSALDTYYKEIVGFIDAIIETHQAKYGIIKEYSSDKYEDYVDNAALVTYFKNLLEFIDNNRTIFKDSDTLNIIDEVKSLVKETLYKIKFLS